MSASPLNINPRFRRNRTVPASHREQLDKLLAGDRYVLGQLISRTESALDEDRALLRYIFGALREDPATIRIGVTGAPGVGKSTFIDHFGAFLVSQGRKVAVLPVDPSSSTSGGSILGDKTRMVRLMNEENAFIKPSPSRDIPGGVGPSTQAGIRLCEAAGFDTIIIETVGVGQSEYLVKGMVDLFLLLVQPGAGDDLQGIKRGIMEMADILIINKSDGELLNASKRALEAYSQSLRLLLPTAWGWKSRAIRYSSVEGGWEAPLMEIIDQYFDSLRQQDHKQKMRLSQNLEWFRQESQKILFEQYLRQSGKSALIAELEASIKSNEMIPLEALSYLQDVLRQDFT